MFCDAAGKPWFPGKVVKTFDWNIANDSALPAWLVAQGTSPVLTYTSPASSMGKLRCTTKVAAPTSGDIAGVETAFTLDSAKFSEIAFICYGVVTDGATTGIDHNFNMQMNNGSAGFYLQNSHTNAGLPALRVYTPAAQDITWDISKADAQKRKDIGVVIRPRTRELFVCSGDPAEGAGVVAYNVGNWVDLTGQTLSARIITRSAAQRYFEFSRIKLRLVSN